MFTPTVDDGICAKCRPAESLLRQRQAGQQMQGELLVVCSLGYGGGTAAHESARAPLAVNRDTRRKEETASASDEDCSQLTQEMGSCSQDHTYPSGTREFDCAALTPV